MSVWPPVCRLLVVGDRAIFMRLNSRLIRICQYETVQQRRLTFPHDLAEGLIEWAVMSRREPAKGTGANL